MVLGSARYSVIALALLSTTEYSGFAGHAKMLPSVSTRKILWFDISPLGTMEDWGTFFGGGECIS